MSSYRSNDDLLADADDVAERQGWEFEEPGDLLAAGKTDIEYYCSQAREESEEEIRVREWEEKWLGSQEHYRFLYVYTGVKEEGFIPTAQDKLDQQQKHGSNEDVIEIPF